MINETEYSNNPLTKEKKKAKNEKWSKGEYKKHLIEVRKGLFRDDTIKKIGSLVQNETRYRQSILLLFLNR